MKQEWMKHVGTRVNDAIKECIRTTKEWDITSTGEQEQIVATSACSVLVVCWFIPTVVFC